jgi:Cellulase (glycosyl hydrolase family 5)
MGHRKAFGSRRHAKARRAWRTARWVTCAPLLLTLCLFAAPASAAEPGVNLVSTSASQNADVGALGTHWVRMFMTWTDMEPERGVWNQNWFWYYEQQFHSLPAGTKVILDAVDTPSWETGSADGHMPPANDGEYASFLATVARRFGSQVAAYEIWNEEDAPAWWSGGPDPVAYTRLLQATYPAVKAAEPNATVVLGGLTGNDYQFLEGVYAAGGKGYFDAVGVHTDTACNVLSPYEYLRGPDGRIITDSFLAYREVHAVMLANGDDKPIWMTELSWRTTKAVCPEGAWAGQKPEGVSDKRQATYLLQAYHCLAEAPYVQVALWFPLQDEGSLVSGLVRANGSRKPSFEAMRRYVRKGDTLTEPCGTFTGPRIAVSSPADHVKYSGPLPLHVSAKSPNGVWRITLKIDGKLIRNYESHAFPPRLSGALEWQGAKHIAPGWHTLTFIAYDKQHNASQTSIAIYHRRSPKARRAAKGSRHGAKGSRHGAKGSRHGAKGHSKKRRRSKRHHRHKRHR